MLLLLLRRSCSPTLQFSTVEQERGSSTGVESSSCRGLKNRIKRGLICCSIFLTTFYWSGPLVASYNKVNLFSARFTKTLNKVVSGLSYRNHSLSEVPEKKEVYYLRYLSHHRKASSGGLPLDESGSVFIIIYAGAWGKYTGLHTTKPPTHEFYMLYLHVIRKLLKGSYTF